MDWFEVIFVGFNVGFLVLYIRILFLKKSGPERLKALRYLPGSMAAIAASNAVLSNMTTTSQPHILIHIVNIGAGILGAFTFEGILYALSKMRRKQEA